MTKAAQREVRAGGDLADLHGRARRRGCVGGMVGGYLHAAQAHREATDLYDRAGDPQSAERHRAGAREDENRAATGCAAATDAAPEGPPDGPVTCRIARQEDTHSRRECE